MTTVSKSATLETLGLPPGDHVVHFHVGVEVISYEVAGEGGRLPEAARTRQPTGFVQRWSATARKIEDKADAWLSHINEKHLR